MDPTLNNLLFNNPITQENLDAPISFLTNILTILIAIISILYVYFTFVYTSNTNTLRSYLKKLETLTIDLLKSNNDNISLKELKGKNNELYYNIEYEGFISLIVSSYLNYEINYNNYSKIIPKMKYLKILIALCFLLFIVILSILLFMLPFNSLASIFLIISFTCIAAFIIFYLNILKYADFNIYPTPTQLLTPSFIIPFINSTYLNVVSDLPLKLFAATTIISIEPFEINNFSFPDNIQKPNPSKISHYITLKSFFNFNINTHPQKNYITLNDHINNSEPKEIKFSIISQTIDDIFIKNLICIFPNWTFNESNNIYNTVESILHASFNTQDANNTERENYQYLIMNNKFYTLNLFMNLPNKSICIFNYNHNISNDKIWYFKPTFADYLLSNSSNKTKKIKFNKDASDSKIFY